MSVGSYSCSGELRRHELRSASHTARLPDERSEAKVDEFQAARAVKHDVLRLDVHVSHTAAVNVRERRCELCRVHDRVVLCVHLQSSDVLYEMATPAADADQR